MESNLLLGAGFVLLAAVCNGTHALPMLAGRLERLYGKDYGLKIRSRKDNGTIVCLRLPATPKQ